MLLSRESRYERASQLNLKALCLRFRFERASGASGGREVRYANRVANQSFDWQNIPNTPFRPSFTTKKSAAMRCKRELAFINVANKTLSLSLISCYYYTLLAK